MAWATASPLPPSPLPTPSIITSTMGFSIGIPSVKHIDYVFFALYQSYYFTTFPGKLQAIFEIFCSKGKISENSPFFGQFLRDFFLGTSDSIGKSWKEEFFLRQKNGKQGNTFCISCCPFCMDGEKDPLSSRRRLIQRFPYFSSWRGRPPGKGLRCAAAGPPPPGCFPYPGCQSRQPPPAGPAEG